MAPNEHGIEVLTGTTTLLGHCIELDGPFLTATIEFPTIGKTWKFAVDEKAYADFEPYLNKPVVLEGTAVWVASTQEMLGFKPTRIVPYEPTDAVTAFDELAKAANGRWDGVDAEEYVRELREDD